MSIQERGFNAVRLSNERKQPAEPPSFSLGKIYNRRTDIHPPFGGNDQSGIAHSR